MNRKTHEQFIEDLINKNKDYRDKKFQVISKYIAARIKVKVKTIYGISHISPNAMLAGKSPCGIASADDKGEYLHKWLLDKNESYREGFFKVISDYVGVHKPIIIETLYGECKLTPSSLLSGSKPGIDSAIDKNSYWINYAKDNNTKSDDYTFEKTKFTNTNTKITITCKKHGDFEIKPSNFTGKNQGCRKCFEGRRKEIYKNNGWDLTSWINKGGDNFYFYIIKCKSNNDNFYKLGITFRSIKERFKNLPYEYEIIDIRCSDDGFRIKCLENYYKRNNKANHYKPKMYFGGSVTECFSKIYDPLKKIYYD